MKYAVKRPHQGDKWYGVGDEREARESDVAHLVKSGVLVPSDQADKDDPRTPAENKAAQVDAVKAAD